MKAIELSAGRFVVFQAQMRIGAIDNEHELIHKNTSFVIVMNNESRVIKVIGAMEFLRKIKTEPENTIVESVARGEDFSIIPQDSPVENILASPHNLIVLVNKARFPVGVVSNLNVIKKISEALSCRGWIDVSEKTQGRVICTDLLPLKEAKREVEEQLVKRAYSIYKNTYKVGEVLEVDQSTVVKILKKYR